MPPNLTATIELVQQAQAGDRAALNRLFERYYDRVLRIVRIRLGPKVRRDFESGDILQQSFVAAVRRFDDFEMRDDASFVNWLRRIVENQITDAAGWQKAAAHDRDREIAIDAPGSDAAPTVHVPGDVTQPLDAMLRNEGRSAVERCLESLAPEYRDLILLRDYEGHSWERVAELTERPSPDAARMKYVTALVELGKTIRAAKGDLAAE